MKDEHSIIVLQLFLSIENSVKPQKKAVFRNTSACSTKKCQITNLKGIALSLYPIAFVKMFLFNTCSAWNEQNNNSRATLHGCSLPMFVHQ